MMTSETFVSFSDYTKRMRGDGIDRRPAYEILREAEEAEASLMREEEETDGNI